MLETIFEKSCRLVRFVTAHAVAGGAVECLSRSATTIPPCLPPDGADMSKSTFPARYLELRNELRRALSETRKWTAVPALLAELDRLRHEGVGSSDLAPRSQARWVGRFIQVVRAVEPAVKAEQARRAARTLWPWLGAYDPEACARGNLQALPRSYA